MVQVMVVQNLVAEKRTEILMDKVQEDAIFCAVLCEVFLQC